MDIAYDPQFQEDVLPKQTDKGKEAEEKEESLNEELQQAYRAISNSPWGARLGVFVGAVRKQGESYIETAKKEYPAVAEQATKGFSDLTTNLVARTRALSITADKGKEKSDEAAEASTTKEQSLLEKLKKGASQRIAEIEAAEARADEYLLKFGTSVGSFLRDAITIAPPVQEKGEIVFETKEDGGKKQIFTTRLDAQLHLLHSNLELFKADPKVESFKPFAERFVVDKETERIAADLERYPGLRTTMEKLVPGEVSYQDFWIRYYFLRNELDLEEKKRKDLLKGASFIEEEVGWDEEVSEEEESEEEEEDDEEEDDDDEEDDEEDDSSDDEEKVPTTKKPAAKASTDTLQPAQKVSTSTDRSSQPDSEASYDVVSAAQSKTPSQAAGSPPKSKVVNDDSSDEADWE